MLKRISANRVSGEFFIPGKGEGFIPGKPPKGKPADGAQLGAEGGATAGGGGGGGVGGGGRDMKMSPKMT